MHVCRLRDAKTWRQACDILLNGYKEKKNLARATMGKDKGDVKNRPNSFASVLGQYSRDFYCGPEGATLPPGLWSKKVKKGIWGRSVLLCAQHV